GLYSRYRNYCRKTAKCLEAFLDFLEINFNEINVNNIFLNKKIQTDIFDHSNMLYLGEKDDPIDKKLIDYCNDAGKVKFYDMKEFLNDKSLIRSETINNVFHYIWFGNMEYGFNINNKRKINNVIYHLLGSNMHIVMVFPFINLFNRILLYNKKQIKAICLYK
ncbi:MAG: hypothetical protein WCD89_09115, partial [Anaerocolumna sp.]